jgi:uncharacterized delta-60 repeat protein
MGDLYGQRLRGYLVPPVTGDYVFYLSADDQAFLYLSTNMAAAAKVLIAREDTWSAPRTWTGRSGGRTNSANVSPPIHLVAGMAYYVEALHKELMGGDHLGVAWQIPGGLTPPNGSDPIPGEFLAYETITNTLPPPSELVDRTFNPIITGAPLLPVINERVDAIAVQPDSKILAGGSFKAVNSIARYNLVRFFPDGSVDLDFSWPLTLFTPRALIVQPDGRILVGGSGTAMETQYVPLLRLNANGSLDPAFRFGAPSSNTLSLTALALQPDGRVIIAYSEYSDPGGRTKTTLVSLNSNGALDPDFGPLNLVSSNRTAIDSICVQADGKILVGGGFKNSSRTMPNYLARVNPDGSVDGDFKPGIDMPVTKVIAQPDGRILIGGNFAKVSGLAREGVARLLPNGSLDPSFNFTEWAGSRPNVHAMTLMPNGCVIIGGIRTPPPGVLYDTAIFLVRLSPEGRLDPNYQVFFPGAAINSFRVHLSTIVVQPNLQVLAGGEFLNAGGLPRTHLVRLLNDVVVPPSITTQPIGQTRYAGQSGVFTVSAEGTSPLSYAWRHNALPIPGGTNATLVIPDLNATHQGEYSVMVANRAGSVISDPATLTVVPVPSIFPPSVSIPANCGPGGYGSSNYKIPDIGADSVELHVVGVYEGRAHVNGVVRVMVHATPKPVVLALSAYQPVVWTVQLDPDARLSAVYVSGYNPQTVLGVALDVPIHQVNFGAYAYGWEPDRNQGGGSYTTVIRNVRSITGFVESSYQGCYAGMDFEVPFNSPANTPPTVVCGGSTTVSATSLNGAYAKVQATVTDAQGDAIGVVWSVDGEPSSTNNLPMGPIVPRTTTYEGWFSVGSHTVSVSATDNRSAPQVCSLTLTVVHDPQPGLVVTSTADSGPGTLRSILASAPTGARITFAVSGSISLTSGELLIEKPVAIQGPGARQLTIQRYPGASAFRLFNIAARGVRISGLTLADGLVSTSGDYVDGGGILNRGALVLSECTFRGHRAVGEYSRGGAICNMTGAELVVNACAFISNSVPGSYGEAGAIYNYGSLWVTNSTFCRNSAGGWGGAIHNDMLSGGTRINSSTFAFNSAGDGGAVFNRGAPPSNVSPVFLRNNILVGNTPDDLSHCSLILSGGYNLIGRITDPYGSMALPIVQGPGDRFNVTPEQVQLANLSMNGGSTPTHALLPRSIALNSGPESGPPATDQRGVVRPFGSRLDIGAFESDVTFTDEGWVVRAISGTSIKLTATPPPGAGAWAVEDTPPQGWPIANITNGVYDLRTGKVKFGPFFDADPRPLGYAVVPPPGYTGIGLVTGTASADGRSTPVVGDSRIVIAWPHPADFSPADWAMRLDEVTSYAGAWRTGGTWPLPPNPIPVAYVTKAASLWQGGENYRVEPAMDGPPQWWVNPGTINKQDLQTAEPGSGIRRAPGGYMAGEPIEVQVLATAPSGGRSFAVQESVPADCTVTSISHGGVVDQIHRQVKWGPFFDNAPRTLRYELTPSALARGPITLSGTASFDGLNVPVTGSELLRPGCSLKWFGNPAMGICNLQLKGEPGVSYVVESSTDLKTWTPVTTVANTEGASEIPISPNPGSSQVYYRARLNH